MFDQSILAQDVITTTSETVKAGASNFADSGMDVYNTVLSVLSGLWQAIQPFLAAALILLIGYWIGKLLGKLIEKALGKVKFDEKIGGYLGLKSDSPNAAGKIFGKFVFYLILVIAFIAALKSADLGEQVIAPFSGMLDKFLGMIPKILAAGVLLVVAIVLARVAREILGRILGATRVDERLGTGENKPVQSAVTTITFWLIILMFLPAVFQALSIETISEPLVQITQDITAYFPKILAGAAIIAVGYLLGSIAQKIIYSLLNAVGFDRLPSKIGYEGKMETEGVKSPSGVVSYIVMVSIIILTTAQAFATMDLGQISAMAEEFTQGFFGILGGVIILGIGIFVANWVSGLLDDRSATLAKVARIAIIIFAAAMAISQADIAPEISQTLFIAIIIAGAFAVGVGGAIALGLGGRERAKEVVDKLGK